MNCKKYESLLLTDYVDGLLDARAQKVCDDHLKECAKCEEMVRDIQVLRETTFGEAPELKPSDRVWEAVSQRIQPSQSWLEKVRAVFTLPRLSFAVPALAIAVWMVFVVNPFPGTNGSYGSAQVYLMQELTGTEGVMALADDVTNEGFGTVIEEYFM